MLNFIWLSLVLNNTTLTYLYSQHLSITNKSQISVALKYHWCKVAVLKRNVKTKKATNMKEIQDIVNAQVKLMAESGEIQKQVEDGVKQAINKAISRQFESYGNITKQLEKAFEENLLLDNRHLSIPSLNAVMTEVVNKNINEFYRGQAADKLHALMKEKLEPIPNEMTVVEFVNMICKEWFADDYESRDDVDDYATVEIEDSLSDCGIISLKIYKKEGGSYSSGEYVDVAFSKNRNKDKSWALQGRHGSTSPYYLFDVDALIFKAYAQGVKFTGVEDFDSDDCDLSLKSDEY